MAGFVYIMSNPLFPSRVKIGLSTKDPTIDRTNQLSKETGVPEPFKCEYYAFVGDERGLEQRVHKELDKKRPNKQKEFFEVTVPLAISTIRRLADSFGGIKYEESFYKSNDLKGIDSKLFDETWWKQATVSDLNAQIELSADLLAIEPWSDNSQHRTALHFSTAGSVACLEVMLNETSGLFTKDDWGEVSFLEAGDIWNRTALHYSTWVSNPAITKLLLDAGANPLAQDALNGGTVLGYAAARDLTGDTLNLLLKAGVDPENSGALWLAAWNGMAKNLKLLLKAGADPKRQGILVNLPRKAGTTDTMKILLEAGADVMERYKYDDSTPLHAAIFADDAEEKVKILLDAGADIRAKDKNGKTAWDYARESDVKLKFEGTKAYRSLKPKWYN